MEFLNCWWDGVISIISFLCIPIYLAMAHHYKRRRVVYSAVAVAVIAIFLTSSYLVVHNGCMR